MLLSYVGMVFYRTERLSADRGDSDAIAIFRECGKKLGEGLSILIDILNPQVIVIGGVYMRCHKFIENSMLTVMRRECLPSNLSAVSVVPSALGEKIGDYGAFAAALINMAAI